MHTASPKGQSRIIFIFNNFQCNIFPDGQIHKESPQQAMKSCFIVSFGGIKFVFTDIRGVYCGHLSGSTVQSSGHQRRLGGCDTAGCSKVLPSCVMVRWTQLAAGGAVLLQSRPSRPAICSRELTPSATLMWV